VTAPTPDAAPRPRTAATVDALKRAVQRGLRPTGYQLVRTSAQADGAAQPTPTPWTWLATLDIGTLVDVGANTGQFARHFRDLRPDCRVYSFEPLRGCFEELERTMQGPDFTAFNVALGESDGEATLLRSEFSPSSSLLEMETAHKELYPFSAATTPETVALRRLDAYVDDIEIRGNLLVKIDVQGAEAQVVNGGRRVISRADAVIAEIGYLPLYRGQATIQQIAGLLNECGLEFMGIVDQIVRPSDSLPVYGDALFVRPSAVDGGREQLSSPGTLPR
jgi:FkbM family methyltransferase